MTWQSTRELLDDGPFGGKAQGCAFCGTVVDYVTTTGKVISYPGVECCPDAIRRQIAWRSEEIKAVNARVDNRRREVEELQRKSADGDRSNLALAARAQRAFDSLMDPGGAWSTELRNLSMEIVRLKKKLASQGDRAA